MRRFLIVSLISFSMLAGYNSQACTNYMITKGASTDGSTMISYAADSHVLYGELYHWNAGIWPAGTMIDVYEWDTGEYLGKIKQAAQTYNVVGNMNEYQVSIGETTFTGIDMLGSQPGAIVDYGSLMFLALQRSKTAREAIKTMVELVAEYGYYSTGESFSIADPNEVWIMEMIGKGKSITVDMKLLANESPAIQKTLKPLKGKVFYTNEAFLDELKKLGGEDFAKTNGEHLSNLLQKGNKGALWVAMRVPDGYVCSHANQARITTFPLEDLKTSISSANLNKINEPGIMCVYANDVISFARERKLVKDAVADQEFSFSDTYAPVDFGAARFSEIRVWSMFNKVNKDMGKYWNYVKGHIEHDSRTGYANNRMPLWVKPDHKVGVREMFDFMRDHLEGTELDMSKDLGAGPFGNPYRWRPLTWKSDDVTYVNERATATQQTGFSFISQMRSWLPREIGGIHWFSVDDAASTVYFPMYSSSTSVPNKFAKGYGKMMEFVDDAAFWVFNQVSNLAYTRYSEIHPEIRKMQDKLELGYIDFTPSVDAKAQELYKKDPAKAVEFLTDYSVNTGNNLVMNWKQFYGYLFTRYMDGNIKEKDGNKQNPKVKQPGYGEKWQKRMADDNGKNLKYEGAPTH